MCMQLTTKTQNRLNKSGRNKLVKLKGDTKTNTHI